MRFGKMVEDRIPTMYNFEEFSNEESGEVDLGGSDDEEYVLLPEKTAYETFLDDNKSVLELDEFRTPFGDYEDDLDNEKGCETKTNEIESSDNDDTESSDNDETESSNNDETESSDNNDTESSIKISPDIQEKIDNIEVFKSFLENFMEDATGGYLHDDEIINLERIISCVFNGEKIIINTINSPNIDISSSEESASSNSTPPTPVKKQMIAVIKEVNETTLYLKKGDELNERISKFKTMGLQYP